MGLAADKPAGRRRDKVDVHWAAIFGYSEQKIVDDTYLYDSIRPS